MGASLIAATRLPRFVHALAQSIRGNPVDRGGVRG